VPAVPEAALKPGCQTALALGWMFPSVARVAARAESAEVVALMLEW